MTWDIYALKGARFRQLDEIPEGFTPPVLGSPEDVVTRIQAAAPQVQVVDAAWLKLEAPDYSVDIAIGKSHEVHDITFYVNSGDGAVAIIQHVCSALGITAFDTDSGEQLTDDTRRATPSPDDEPEVGRRWWQRRG